jgi:hypothetical protein
MFLREIHPFKMFKIETMTFADPCEASWIRPGDGRNGPKSLGSTAGGKSIHSVIAATWNARCSLNQNIFSINFMRKSELWRSLSVCFIHSETISFSRRRRRHG